MEPAALYPLYGKGKKDGVETYVQMPHRMAMQYVQMALEVRFNYGAPVLDDPMLLRDFVQMELGRREGEVFGVLLLDSGSRFLDYVELFHGTDSVEIEAQPLVECILKHKASEVVFVHNHVSGHFEAPVVGSHHCL